MNDIRRNYGATTARADGLAIDQGLRQYMLGVYNYMAMAVAGTGLVSLAVASNPSLVASIAGTPLKWVLFAAILGIGWFAPRVIFSGSKTAAHGLFWIYAAAWGAMIAPMLFAFNAAGAAQEIYKAFFITASVFGATSLYGYTTRRDLSQFGSFLIMGLIGVVIASIVNIFLASSALQFAVSVIGILVFVGLTAWDTQTIKEQYAEGLGAETNQKLAVSGAFSLYLNFINIFQLLLNFTGQREE